MEVGPLFATPEQTARRAVANDVHVVGVSTLAAGHLTTFRRCSRRWRQTGRADILIAVGGVVPAQDYEALKAAGVAAIFPPGTVAAEAAEELLDELNRRLGYAQRARPRNESGLLRGFQRQRFAVVRLGARVAS